MGLAALGAAGSDARAGERDGAASWLDARYRETPIGLGWRVLEIEPAGSGARVAVVLPTRQADRLSKRPVNLQATAVASIVCPRAADEVWSLVDAADDIAVRLSSAASPEVAFIEVACRDIAF